MNEERKQDFLTFAAKIGKVSPSQLGYLWKQYCLKYQPPAEPKPIEDLDSIITPLFTSQYK